MFDEERQAEGTGFETRSSAHLKRTPNGLALVCSCCGATASHHELTRAELVHAFKLSHSRCRTPSKSS